MKYKKDNDGFYVTIPSKEDITKLVQLITKAGLVNTKNYQCLENERIREACYNIYFLFGDSFNLQKMNETQIFSIKIYKKSVDKLLIELPKAISYIEYTYSKSRTKIEFYFNDQHAESVYNLLNNTLNILLKYKGD